MDKNHQEDLIDIDGETPQPIRSSWCIHTLVHVVQDMVIIMITIMIGIITHTTVIIHIIGHITITHIIGNHQGYFGSPTVGD